MKLKKRNASESLIKKTVKPKAINPFEIRINKQKFDVLGRKLKNDRGLPGIARAKSIKQRKETLLQEYKVKDKSNKFVDRRIGENNTTMTPEDRIMARYTAERIKSHNKKTMFNLAEDEVLTHRGKALSEIEKYDNPGSDDEEQFGERGGGLEAGIVEAHFGGEIFREKGEGVKTHASLIDELIADSKKRKADRQRAKEQTLELTDKLDAEWRDLIPLVGQGKATDDAEQKPEKGSYDQIMRELKFESRGMPSDRLKSEDEIAKEDKEKLEKLEEERIRRMRGVDDAKSSQVKTKHISADDLDDGLDLDSEIEDIEDGEDGTSDQQTQVKTGDASESEEDEEDADDNTDFEETIREENEADNTKTTNSEIEEKEVATNSENEESESDDDLSDLKDDEEKEDERFAKDSPNEESTTICDEPSNDVFLESLKEKKIQMEKARKELPYTFQAPENYEQLENVMSGHSVDEQQVIIERMIKCSHPSLGENNKKKLEALFAFLLQFLNDAEDDVVWKLLDRLAPSLFDLTQFSSDNSAQCILEVVNEKYEDFKKQPRKFPQSDTLVFLKLIPILFPTSDIRHKVTTPAYIFLLELLNQCRVNNRKTISTGIFVVTILLEYTFLSNKYCPEVINFLQGVLEMAIVDTPVSLPFCKANYHPLVLETPVESNNEDNKLTFADLNSSDFPVDDSFRICAMSTTVYLLEICRKQLENIASFRTIFEPIESRIKQLKISRYPPTLKNEIMNFKKRLSNAFNMKLMPVMLEAKKPKALRLYEPLIERVTEGKRRKDIPEEQAEHQKLVGKYKREMKGALREIRRDNAFLSNVKLRKQAKSDEERKRKVKEIYSWASAQEGEFNKMKRKKKH